MFSERNLPDKSVKMADFTIESKPVSIRFTCPHCEADTEIAFKDVDVPECWSDPWPEVVCPMCGELVQLSDWTYD